MKKASEELASNPTGVFNDKPSVSTVIRMAQAVAERNMQSPERKNAPAIKQAIESVLKMIEAKSGNGAEIQKLTSLVRQAICTRPLNEKKPSTIKRHMIAFHSNTNQ